MNRRRLSFFALALFLVLALYLGRRALPEPMTSAPRPAAAERIASLSPAITDTIVALGAEASLVLVSDYCSLPGVPRAGTIISPQFERIASTKPHLILATRVAGSPDRDLKRLAPLVSLPWLTLAEVTGSIRRVGEAIDRTAEGEELAQRMAEELADRAPPDAPRVLLLMGPITEERVGYFYIRHESLHGRLLSASGYRNAMGTVPHPGQPRLTVEELLRVDPDAILVLQEAPASGEPPLGSLAPLAAVRAKRTGVLSRAGILSMGPDILAVRRLVQAALDRWFQERQP